jgi:hypothetical protein
MKDEDEALQKFLMGAWIIGQSRSTLGLGLLHKTGLGLWG